MNFNLFRNQSQLPFNSYLFLQSSNNEHEQMPDFQSFFQNPLIFPNIPKQQPETLKIAILITGLTRHFRQASKSLLNWIDKTQSLTDKKIQFDIFLHTWNIQGDYRYSEKDFSKPLSSNWVKATSPLLSEKDIEDLKAIYKPKLLTIDDYKAWQTTIKPEFDEFIQKHKLGDEALRIYNGIFSQYYGIHKANEAFQKYVQTNEQREYDLVIRTRYDIQITYDQTYFIPNEPMIFGNTDTSTTNTSNQDTIYDLKNSTESINNQNGTQHQNTLYDKWVDLANFGQSHLVCLDTWDRNGIKGNFIATSLQNFTKYATLYPNLAHFTQIDIKRLKLASIHIPKFIFNYLFDKNDRELKDKFPEDMDKLEILQRTYEYLTKQLNSFVSDPANLTFHFSLIPEILLAWYVESYQSIPIHEEKEFLQICIYPDPES